MMARHSHGKGLKRKVRTADSKQTNGINISNCRINYYYFQRMRKLRTEIVLVTHLLYSHICAQYTISYVDDAYMTITFHEVTQIQRHRSACHRQCQASTTAATTITTIPTQLIQRDRTHLFL